MRYLIGRREEADAQRSIQDQAYSKFVKAYEAEIARASLLMVADFEKTGGTPQMPIDHASRLAELWASMGYACIAGIGGRLLSFGVKNASPYTTDGGKTFRFAKCAGNGPRTIETKEGFAELFARLALEYIQAEMIRRRITMVSETTRRQIVNLIQAGQENGDSVAEIAKAIREAVPSISGLRSHILARTETHGAVNYGAQEAARATGLKLNKEWVSVEDHRTRDFGEGDGVIDAFNHRDMNGQTVPMDAPFRMTHKSGEVYQCQHPGDPSLPAGAVINCRCQVVHVVAD